MEVLLCHAPVAVMAYPGTRQMLKLPHKRKKKQDVEKGTYVS